MNGPEDGRNGTVDEFEWIAKGLRPLAAGAPEALGLLDDAAAIAARPGFDLIVSKDAIVEGVHFLPDDPPGAVASKLLRVNLSDLAAKGAEPYGYFLAVAWPPRFGWPERRAFAAGLKVDQDRFGLKLFGGDTTATPGPLTASVTVLGWAPAGAMVRRGAAQAGDVMLVSGTIGDGWLGLTAARGGADQFAAEDRAYLVDRYRLPQPRLGFGEALRGLAHAACDVSDGLIADASNIATASGVGLAVELERIPLSAPAQAWLSGRQDEATARSALASGGDDYEIVCAAPPQAVPVLVEAFARGGVALTEVGRFTAEPGLRLTCAGRAVPVNRTGYRHG